MNSNIKKIPGPILILGAGGFIGANLFYYLNRYRKDVWGTYNSPNPWRLKNCKNIVAFSESNIKPKTIFDCIAYGNYSWQTNIEQVYDTNFNRLVTSLEAIKGKDITYIHAGTSSEYGLNSNAPEESDTCEPNSHYAVSKLSAANLIQYYGTFHDIRCANLRFYSAYGPMEDSSRLIPQIIINGNQGKYPKFVNPLVTRDFVYIDDISNAFIKTAANLEKSQYGESFNIGTGRITSIKDIAFIAQDIYNIKAKPKLGQMANRYWDTPEPWVSNSRKAKNYLGWSAQTSLEQGLRLTDLWYKSLGKQQQIEYINSTKQGT